MEVKRERLVEPFDARAAALRGELRVRQLRARDLLRGDLEGADLDQYVEERVLTTTLDKALNWARSNALWPATFGLACCAIEMMSIVTRATTVARFGAEVFRASPRQADMLILSGRVSIKMAPVIRRIYDQMLEPKWVIAMGACASSAGVFNNYALVAGADKFLPVDVHVPGCPPRPEALIHGILKLQRKVQGHPDLGWRARYQAEGTEERPHPNVAAAAGETADGVAGSAPDAGRHRTRADRARAARALPGLGRGHPPLPRQRDAGRRARTGARRAALAARRARARSTASSPACTAPTTCRPSRASASTTSCSTWSGSSAST